MFRPALVFFLAFGLFLGVVAVPAQPLVVGPGQEASLESLRPGGGRSLWLDLSQTQLNRAPRAKASLLKWVRGGGVVVLRTDAAQLFGFKTVRPRGRTRERAGQKFGRGEAALPFGASPLLLGAQSQSLDGKGMGFLGVRTVFYQLREPDPRSGFGGDCLLSDVARGWPLLRVSDVAPQEKEQWAAALLPFGRGFALFLPGVVEGRADGTTFGRNVRAFLDGAARREWATLPVAPIRRAFDEATDGKRVEFAALSSAAQNALKGTPTEEAPTETTSTEAPLLVSRDELQTLASMWERAQNGGEAEEARGRSLVLELAGRWTLSQADDGEPVKAGERPTLARLFAADSGGRDELAQTQADGPHAGTTRWWCGVFAFAQTIAPTSTQPQGARWPEPVAFSLAVPALEAGNWWKNTSAQGVARSQVVDCAASAMQMAQGHKDDPPLLMTWRTKNGAKWKLLLTPMEAVSDRFPADVREWGVPATTFSSQAEGRVEFWPFNLRRIGSENAMDPRQSYATITHNLGNQLRWQMLRVVSESLEGWSEGETTTWVLFPVQPFQHLTFGRGVHNGKRTTAAANIIGFDNMFLPHVRGNAVIFPGYFSLPIPTMDAYLHMAESGYLRKNQSEQGDRADVDDRFEDWTSLPYYSWSTNFMAQTKTFPPRYARVVSSLQVRALTEQVPAEGSAKGAVPAWIEQGLQNLSSLHSAELLEDPASQSQWYPVPPAPVQEYLARQQDDPHARLLPQITWNRMLNYGISSARTRSLVASPVDRPTSMRDLPEEADDEEAYTGVPLEDEDATRQMRFFLDRFGRGALTETIQRLGAGQSIDAALQETIGMNQNAFFALWREQDDEDDEDDQDP